VAVRVDQRADSFHSPGYDGFQCDPFLTEVNPSAGDAGDVEEVVHEARQMPDLAGHHYS
jgi:hypothetical protein